MKNYALSAVAVAALAGSTLAAVQEPVNVGTRPVLFAANAAASLANGITLPVTLTGYTTRGVRLSGQVTTLATNSWPSDLRMSIYAPGATTPLTTVQFDARNASGVFDINFAWSPLSSAAVPTGMPQTAGNWTITIWDAALDGAGGTEPEAQFDNLVISMDDDISPASVATAQNMTSASGSILHNFTLGSPVKWYLVTVPAANNAATPPSYFEIFTGGPNTILSDSELSLWQTNQDFNAAGVTAPVNTQQIGSRIALDFQDGDGAQAALSFGIGSGLVLGSSDGALGGGGDGNLAAGQYYLAVVAGQRGYYTRNWGSLVINDTFDGQVDINWRSGTRIVSLPNATDLGTLPINQTIAGGPTDLTGAKWFKFVAPTDIGFMSNNFLDIRTAPGAGLATNTELAIFREQTGGITTGALVAQNDDITAGTNLFSRLSFGAGAGVGTPTGGTGQSGTLVGGNTYWVAASNFDTTFSAGFGANAPAGPDFDVIFASGSRTQPDNTGVPTTFTTLPFPNNTTTTTEVTLAAGEVKWFKTTVPVELNNTTGKHLDIWTSAVAEAAARPAEEDTEIALFSRDGRGNIDDDDGPDPFYSQLTYGGGAARAAILNSSAFDNRDSGLSADDYYIAVGLFDVTYGFNFAAPGLSTDFGSVNLNLRSNHVVVPACNNPSNVAGANQSTTPDSSLTADDIIVFLGWFFANDTRADVAGANQSIGADGNFTADDIIVFLGRYFQGC